MTTPGPSQAADPARRQVGESYKDYADRIYGTYRALRLDMELGVDTIWMVFVEDRHTDVEVEVWRDRESALRRAAELVAENTRHPEDVSDGELNDAMIRSGWIYYVRYSCEGDCVRVVETHLRG